MGPIPYGDNDAHTFASSLLSFGRTTAPSLPSTSFDLPGFRLTVASDSSDYLAICRRALVDDPDFAPERRLELVVLDYETHPDMPRGIWVGEMFGPNLLDLGLKPTSIRGSASTDDQLLQFFDPSTGLGIEALAEPERYPPWIASFPLRNFLHWAYQAVGWRIVHAGTLSIGGSGALLIGEGGSGKSATVLAGVLAQLDSAGDDYVVMEVDEERIRAHPVTKLMKQDVAGLHRLGIDPAAAQLGQPNWQAKHEFDFDKLGRGRRAGTIDLVAILLPRVAHCRRTTITRASAQEAMLGLAPSNLQQLPGGWREGLSFIGGVVRRLPAYHLELSEDPKEIAGVIADFLAARRV